MTHEQIFEILKLYAIDDIAGAWMIENAFSTTLFGPSEKIAEQIADISEFSDHYDMVKRSEMNDIIEGVERILEDFGDVQTSCAMFRLAKITPGRANDLTGEVLRVIFKSFEEKLSMVIAKIQKERSDEMKEDRVAFEMTRYVRTEPVAEIMVCLSEISVEIAKLDKDLTYAMVLYGNLKM